MPTTTAKPEAPAAEHPPAVDKPKHRLSALTTYELRDYRSQLESAIRFFGTIDAVPPVRADLQAALDDVLAEQDDRTRIARA
ncbi:MAG: hypothetical protein ACRDRJ_10760 [Streptosporangiaceae bacterium]